MKFYLLIAVLLVIQGCSDLQNPAGSGSDKMQFGNTPHSPWSFRTIIDLEPGETQYFSRQHGSIKCDSFAYFMIRNLNPSTRRGLADSIDYTFWDLVQNPPYGGFFGTVRSFLLPGDSVVGENPPYDGISIHNIEEHPIKLEVFLTE